MTGKRGRPSTYNDETAARIADLIGAGCTLHEASLSVGVPRSTVDGWLEKHPDFSALCAMASAKAVTDNLANIKRLSKKDWRASQWLLEKADPKRFGPKVEVEISITQLEQLSDEDLYQIVTNSQLPNQIAGSGLIGTAEETEAVIAGELVP